MLRELHNLKGDACEMADIPMKIGRMTDHWKKTPGPVDGRFCIS